MPSQTFLFQMNKPHFKKNEIPPKGIQIPYLVSEQIPTVTKVYL